MRTFEVNIINALGEERYVIVHARSRTAARKQMEAEGYQVIGLSAR